jgi:hypothetical protein
MKSEMKGTSPIRAGRTTVFHHFRCTRRSLARHGASFSLFGLLPFNFCLVFSPLPPLHYRARVRDMLHTR